MAIKRLQSQPVFNKPIGVVQPSTAGVRAGQELEQIGTRMMQQAFQQEVEVQKQKGVDVARNFQTRTTDGRIEYRSLPQGLSKIAEKEAQSLIDKKYSAALFKDMKNEAIRLRADFDKDPDGFDNAYSAYVKKTAELTDERYKAMAIDIGAEIAGENTAALYADKVDAEDAQDFKDMYDRIIESSDDLEAFISNGAPVSDSSVAHASYKNLLREIDELIDVHGDRMSVTQATNLRTTLKRQYGGALANSVVKKLTSLSAFQDPAMGEELAANVINGLEQAFRTGSVDGLEPSVVKYLTDAGFSERMISSELFDAEDRRIIAGDISVLENNFQERLQATKDSRRADATQILLSQGYLVSQDDMDNLFAKNGIKDVESFMNSLGNIMNPANAETKPIRNLLLHTNSDLPKVVQNLFTSDNLERLANTGQLPIAMDLYQQTTKRLNKDGSGVNTVTRGLSDNVIVEMEALDAYRNSVKQASFQEYFQLRNELARNPQRKEILNAKLGMDGDKQIKIADFVNDQLDSDASPEEAAYYMQYAEDLVLMHGKELAGEILNQSSNKVFVKSSFIMGEGRTRFAPEKAFPMASDMAVFKTHTQGLLDMAGDYTLGKDAFLIPDPRHGTVNPVYMIVDENKMPIMAGSEPLLASGQAVVEQRMRLKNQTTEQLRKKMREEQQRRLKFGRKIDEGDPQTIDDIARTARGY
jgi:hypothetical protein